MASTLQASLLLNPKLAHSRASLDIMRLPPPTNLLVCVDSAIRQAAITPKSKKVSKYITSHSWLLHSSVSNPARLQPFRAQLIQFNASRKLNIPCREGAFPAGEYLKEVERVVKVTFPDSARIAYLGDSVWQSRLKPVTFFTISATPVCDIRVYNDGEALQIESDRLLLDFSGLPKEFTNLNLQFSLHGQLQASAEKGSLFKPGRQVEFNGEVLLGLGLNLPLPFSLFPETLVTTVGDGILATILGAMKSSLLRGVLADYHSWCLAKQSVGSSRTVRLVG